MMTRGFIFCFATLYTSHSSCHDQFMNLFRGEYNYIQRLPFPSEVAKNVWDSRIMWRIRNTWNTARVKNYSEITKTTNRTKCYNNSGEGKATESCLKS